jgi:short-subunit dehydrogenase
MTALITGASSGIGLELARVFAAHGTNVILVARQEAKLHALAAELQQSAVRTDVIVADLAAPDGPASVVAAVQSLGLDVDILVNNAGFGSYGPFLESPLETALSMIQVNIAAVTDLTRRFLPAMVARRSGRIMIVASTAAFFPGPLMAVYYATKAYLLSFSEAIANELQGTGVTVTALCPGATESGFAAAANQEDSRLIAGRKLPTSREVAEEGYAGLIAGKTVVITGVSNKLSVLVPRLLPRRVVARIVRAAQERKI